MERDRPRPSLRPRRLLREGEDSSWEPFSSPPAAPTGSRSLTWRWELDEEVRSKGVQKAVGELVTCPFRTSVTLAALAGADLLQFARAGLEKASSCGGNLADRTRA